jgi:multiple sugar transport system substrate-binding protein
MAIARLAPDPVFRQASPDPDPQMRFRFHALLLSSLALLLAACSPEAPEGPVEVTLWTSWAGFEKKALDGIVEDFNRTQDEVRVRCLNFSQLERKLLLATAAGNPPDLAFLPYGALPAYAENNALIPLDRFCAEAGITRDQYIDIFWEICAHRGHLWALPITASVTALHWNKTLFRAAGLDPERPPRSLDELEAFNDAITRFRDDGSIDILGHFPMEPGWWLSYFNLWFGGRLWDGEEITVSSPENLEMARWISGYPERFGADNLLRFQSGFGTFASPQNAFFTGRVAMVLQGVWMDNFIRNYASPDFEYGVAPFPSADPDRLTEVSLAEPDSLSIPTGARHPEEAFKFLIYLNRQEVLEKLALGQRKMTSLRAVSEPFLAGHPHPYIEVFIEIAASPNVGRKPPIAQRNQLEAEMRNTIGLLLRQKVTPVQGLAAVQAQQERIYDRNRIRWSRVEEARQEGWARP